MAGPAALCPGHRVVDRAGRCRCSGTRGPCSSRRSSRAGPVRLAVRRRQRRERLLRPVTERLRPQGGAVRPVRRTDRPRAVHEPLLVQLPPLPAPPPGRPQGVTPSRFGVAPVCRADGHSVPVPGFPSDPPCSVVPGRPGPTALRAYRGRAGAVPRCALHRRRSLASARSARAPGRRGGPTEMGGQTGYGTGGAVEREHPWRAIALWVVFVPVSSSRQRAGPERGQRRGPGVGETGGPT